jgi:hypothetical protein
MSLSLVFRAGVLILRFGSDAGFDLMKSGPVGPDVADVVCLCAGKNAMLVGRRVLPFAEFLLNQKIQHAN